MSVAPKQVRDKGSAEATCFLHHTLRHESCAQLADVEIVGHASGADPMSMAELVALSASAKKVVIWQKQDNKGRSPSEREAASTL